MGPPLYHLPGNVISATVGLVYNNLQPEYELRNSTRFGQFQKLEKMSWVTPAALHRIKFSTGSKFLFIVTCASDLTFLAPLTSEI